MGHVNPTLRAVLLIGSAGLGSLLAGPAFAQASPETGPTAMVGEVVVTAQRRAQSIQDVGISITALTGEQLTALGVTSTQDLARHVPNIQFDGGSGGGLNAFVSIRGVSQVDPSEHQEAPNAVYLDEVYVPTPSMVGFPSYDMARAEALRGPQGTLFGRNSTGGLLQFVTTDPSAEPGGYVTAQYGSYETYRLEGAYGGPIADGLSFRVAGFQTKGNGYFKNLAPGEKDTFETDSYGIRAKLAAELPGDWTFKLTGSINKTPRHREGTYKSVPVYVDASGVTQVLPPDLDFYGTGPGRDPFGYRDPGLNFHTGEFNSDIGRIEKSFNYVTAKFEGPIGGARFVSITNVSRGKIHYGEDADGTPIRAFEFTSDGDTKQFSQEFRVSGDTERLNWTAGAYALRLDGDYFTIFHLPFLDATPTPLNSLNAYRQKTRSMAVFGQVEYKLTDTLKMTVGGRYTHDKKTFRSSVTDYAGQVVYLFDSTTVGGLAKQSKGDWAGKVQLDYEPSRAVLLYAGVSRGIRGGGFNATADGGIPLAETPFKNESVIAYEAGAKFRLFDGRASFRTAAFYYDYKNYQAFNFIGLITRVSNNPAVYYGAEAELNATPMKGLDLSLGASVLEAEVKNLNTGSGGIRDVEPVKAPPFTFNGVIAKTFELGDGELRLQYDVNFTARHRSNLVPSPFTSLPSSWIQNARVSYGQPEQGWQVYAFVDNLANEARRNFAYDNAFVGIGLYSYAPPRRWGAGFRKTF